MDLGILFLKHFDHPSWYFIFTYKDVKQSS